MLAAQVILGHGGWLLTGRGSERLDEMRQILLILGGIGIRNSNNFCNGMTRELKSNNGMQLIKLLPRNQLIIHRFLVSFVW